MPSPAAGSRPDDRRDPAVLAALAAELRSLAVEEGLDAIGFASVAPFTETRVEIERRVAEGLHDGMRFTFAKPERSTTPAALLPDAATLVVAARSYRRVVPPVPGPGAHGRIARYAWTDHYRSLRGGLTRLGLRLRADGWRSRVVADDNALVDRAAAYRAGIGWLGKNANILLPGRGSWFILGALVTDAPFPTNQAPVDDACGACARCIDGCPTAAIVAPGVVDARRCLAWLVQRPGPFPTEFAAALGDRIYGCDDCQEVCPPNRMLDRHAPPPEAEPGARAWTDLLALAVDPDEAIVERHGRFYLPGRDPSTLRRNAVLALANVADPHDPDVAAAVASAADHRDEGVRAAAAWAADRLAARRASH